MTVEGARVRPFPVHSLEASLQIVQAIVDGGAARPMDRLLVAQAIGRTPSSSEFRRLLSSSAKYGLTEGTEKADLIKPTPLGLQITKPLSDDERRAAVLRAALTPSLFKDITQHFNKQKLPKADFFKNVLERQFAVDPEHSSELAALLINNLRFVGAVQSIGPSEYINTDLIQIAPSTLADEGNPTSLRDVGTEAVPAVEVQSVKADIVVPSRPKKIFVAHGKNHHALKEVQAILGKFKIPHIVAMEEAHAGRPISAKVAQTMQDCSAGIFVFTKDEEFRLHDGSTVWRPSENVVFELGAGSVLWGGKIIVLKERGVEFASDYKDLGYITFESGQLGAIAMQLFMELIALDFIKVEPV